MNEKQAMSHRNQAKRKQGLERSFYSFKPRIAMAENGGGTLGDGEAAMNIRILEKV